MAIEVEKIKDNEIQSLALIANEKRMTIFQLRSWADLFFNCEDYSIPYDLLNNTIKPVFIIPAEDAYIYKCFNDLYTGIMNVPEKKGVNNSGIEINNNIITIDSDEPSQWDCNSYNKMIIKKDDNNIIVEFVLCDLNGIRIRSSGTNLYSYFEVFYQFFYELLEYQKKDSPKLIKKH